ncbi:hypothetical protein BWI17_04095 [Betaproteobacteria bacterium GR16-43]|nr:hypothetical protein BWI17_04095 [Betaproteobacteria bacterium GR16-43]
MKRILTGCAVFATALAAYVPAFAQELGPAVRESTTDVQVQEEVLTRLLADHRLDHSLLMVSVHDGHVSVTGTMKDESQEAEIYRVARTVPGVRDVFVFGETDSE